MQKQTSKKQKTNSKKLKVESISQTIEDKQYSKSLKGLLRALKDNKKERAKEILESLTEKEQDEIFKYIENNWDKDLPAEKKKNIDKILSIIFEINKEKLKEKPEGKEETNDMLLKAGESGKISTLLASLFKGANINASNKEEWTLAHNAAWENKILMLQFLTKKKYLGENIKWGKRNEDGGIFLHSATWNGHLEVIKFFFEDKDAFKLIKNFIYFMDKDQETIMGGAEAYDEVEIKNYLMKIGYNPFIGNVEEKVGDLKEYKQKWLNAIKNSATIEELRENLRKEGVNVSEDLLELSFTYMDSNFASILAENCSPLLFNIIKSR